MSPGQEPESQLDDEVHGDNAVSVRIFQWVPHNFRPNEHRSAVGPFVERRAGGQVNWAYRGLKPFATADQRDIGFVNRPQP